MYENITWSTSCPKFIDMHKMADYVIAIAHLLEVEWLFTLR
jgi:hypothetical protein